MSKVYILMLCLLVAFCVQAKDHATTKLLKKSHFNLNEEAYQISVDSQKSKELDISLVNSDIESKQKDYLQLSIENSIDNELSYVLVDSNNRIRMSSVIREKENFIRLTPYIAGTYYLKVKKEDKIIMSFKIIKQ